MLPTRRDFLLVKGRFVGTTALESSADVFLSAMGAGAGLDPAKDINWVTSANPKPIELFLDGKVDAFPGFPPEPQRLRAQNVGNVIVKSAQDRPRSQYFCCMLAGNPEFARTKPIAAKRVVRAMLRATDLCLSARPGSRGKSSAAASPQSMTMRSTRSRTCPMGSGATTIPRTRSASMCCACSNRVRQDHRRRHRPAILARAEEGTRVIP
jgi:ABC-type nitrate/sulfonate/bicarbonate transport system substrate-binding protein